MTGLSHHSAIMAQGSPIRVADTALYTVASSLPVTFPAPTNRVVGSIMVAMIQTTDTTGGGAAWFPVCADGHWTSASGSFWSGGPSGGAGDRFVRIADGTSNDNLVITKSGGGGATVVVAYIVAFRNATTYTASTGSGGIPGMARGVTPSTSPWEAYIALPHDGLWMGTIVLSDGRQPYSTSGVTVPGAYKYETRTPTALATDPLVELWLSRQFAGGTMFPPAPNGNWTGICAGGFLVSTFGYSGLVSA